MTEPERLEVGDPQRRPGWLVLLVTVAVLAGLLVVRLIGSESPAPDTMRPSSSAASTRVSSAAAPPWPVGRGLPTGTLYVLATDDVYSIDVSGGLVAPLGLDHIDPDKTALIPMAPGILMQSNDVKSKRRLWNAAMTPKQPLDPIRSAASVLPGPGDDVWITTKQDRDSNKDALWVLADDRGATGPQVRVRGLAVPDGSGGLLDVEPTRVRYVGPGVTGGVVGTYLTAVGPDGLLMDSCTAGLCTPELRDRSSGRQTPLGPAVPPSPDRAAAFLDPGMLSPRNRFLAESASSQDGGFELRVSAATAPLKPIRTIPVGSRSTAITWLSDRWLVATSADTLLIYDAVNDTVIAPSLPLRHPTQLVFQPST